VHMYEYGIVYMCVEFSLCVYVVHGVCVRELCA
jgi:hypothetical protein